MPPRGDVEVACPPLPFLWLRPFPAGFGRASERLEGPQWGPRWLTQSWAAGTFPLFCCSRLQNRPPRAPGLLLAGRWRLKKGVAGPLPGCLSGTWRGWALQSAGLTLSRCLSSGSRSSLPFSPPHFQSLSTGSWLALPFGVLFASFLRARPLPVSQGKPQRDLFSVCLSSELLAGS